MAKVTVHTEGGYRSVITNPENLTAIADETVESGGTSAGLTPSQLLLGALGSCMAITAKMYAERKGWPLEDVRIELEHERFENGAYAPYTGSEPFVHEIRERFTLIGDLDEKQRERIIAIAQKCPVRRVLQYPVFFVDEVVKQELTAEGE